MGDGVAPGVLIVLGGLPGVGKSTVARLVCAGRRAVLLRIDSIEQAIRDAGVPHAGVGTAGYRVAHALAAANLTSGLDVVADAVNPVDEARAGWSVTAREVGARLLTVELRCSDAAEHRRRIERRVAEVPGLRLPTWASVAGRQDRPWTDADLRIDTTLHSAAEAAALIELSLVNLGSAPARGNRGTGR